MAERRPAIAAALALALAGCSFVPKYDRPAAPVAQAFPGAEPAASGAGSVPASDLGWRDVLSDPRLQRLVEFALENNRDLRVAGLNVELVQAQYRIQRAQELPAVGAFATETTTRTPADLSTSRTHTTTSTWSVGLGVTAFELDFFGRLRSLSQAALEQFLSTEEARRSARLSLIAAVADQYLTTRALDDQIDLARQTLDIVEKSLALTRRTYEAGRSSELDLRVAETQVETARYNLATAVNQRTRAENALVLLVGAPLPADLPAPMALDAQPVVAELPAGLPAEVLTRRPDVLAAEHALLAANANIGAARAAFFPQITLTGSGGLASGDLFSLFSGDQFTFTVSPRLSVPIFTAGALKASLDATQVRKSIQIAQYERAIQAAFREVADGLGTRASLDEALRAEEARVRAEQRRYDLSDLRYRKGVDSYLGVLTAQRDLFSAQQTLIQARLARLTNLVDLYRALGGGWKERTADQGGDAPAAGVLAPAAPARRGPA